MSTAKDLRPRRMPGQPIGRGVLPPQQQAEFNIYTRLETLLANPAKKPLHRLAQQVADEVWLLSIAHVLRMGSFRLPGGMGVIRMQRFKPAMKRTKAGTYVPAPPRATIKFQPGPAIAFVIGRPSDLVRQRKHPHLVELVHTLRDAHDVDVLVDADTYLSFVARDLSSVQSTPTPEPETK